MTLRSFGPLTFGEVVGEFGGVAPHQFTEYYGKAPGIPVSGQMKLSDFYGKSSYLPAPVIMPVGTTYYTVPPGVTVLSIDELRAGGGGGGGNDSSGNTFRRGSGGGGGRLGPFNLAVTPGEVLTMVVGAGGLRASAHYNGVWFSQTPGNEWNTAGLPGGTTAIYRGGTLLASASGGGGGTPYVGGAAGAPNGVAGKYFIAANNFHVKLGGDPAPSLGGVAYGRGGCSNHSQVYYIYQERSNNALSGGDGWPGVIAFRPRLSGEATAPRTVTRTAVGTEQWVVAAGVKMINAIIQGGGGGVGMEQVYVSGSGGDTDSGGGWEMVYIDGCNASVEEFIIPVNPGDVCTLKVGGGGAANGAGASSTLTVNGVVYTATGGPSTAGAYVEGSWMNKEISYPPAGQKSAYQYATGRGGTQAAPSGISGRVDILY